MTALAITAAQHAVPELARAEVADDVPARRLDVERLAREEIDVRRSVVRERVAARVALRQKHDARDGERAVELVLGDGGRADWRETELRRQIDKRFTNAVTVQPGGIASEGIRNPVKSQHGVHDLAGTRKQANFGVFLAVCQNVGSV